MTAVDECVPISSQQLYLCAPALYDSFHPRWIISRALRVAGPIDLVALQAALDDLVIRHEALRTTVMRFAQPPYQRVHPPAPVPLTVHDLPAGSESARQAAA